MNPALQMSIIIGVFCVLLNVIFFFLSAAYFKDKAATAGLMGDPITDDTVNGVRIAFLMFTGVVTVSAAGAMFAPKIVSHALSVVAGIVAFVGAYYAFDKGMTKVLPVALMVLGTMFPLLVWRSLAKSRAAWSFLVALCFSLAVVLLFGAPKIRAQVGIGLWIAMIIPGMLVVAGISLTMLRREYRGSDTTAA
ncbi:MAG: hypothetical protein ABI867_03360 [Kofleriaceae bacterium]